MYVGKGDFIKFIKIQSTAKFEQRHDLISTSGTYSDVYLHYNGEEHKVKTMKMSNPYSGKSDATKLFCALRNMHFKTIKAHE